MRYLCLIISLFLFSCGTFAPEREEHAPTKKEQIKHEPVDVKDIEQAKETLKDNSKKRMAVVSKGKERKQRFEPLMLKLIAFTDYGQELKLSDVQPYRQELPNISAVFTNDETNEFVRMATEDKSAQQALIQEAEKGEGNDSLIEQLKEEKAELIKQREEDTSERTFSIAEKFLYIGACFIALSCFSFIPFVAVASGKIQKTGWLLLAIGGIIMLFGQFNLAVREFLKQWGNIVIGLSVIPVIILGWLIVAKKGDKIVDEIKD